MKNILLVLVKKKIIRFFDFYISKKIVGSSEPEIMCLVAFLSYFTWKGNTCLPIKYFNTEDKLNKRNFIFTKKIKDFIKYEEVLWIKKIKSSIFITENPKLNISPIVFFKKKLYFYSMWKLERKAINFFSKKSVHITINVKNHLKIMKYLFHKESEQKTAVSFCMFNNIALILGEAGTGKTTTISKLVIALFFTFKKKINVQLATPTGKSSTKLFFILKTAIKHIEHSKQVRIKDHIYYNVSTIHSLLKMREEYAKPFFNKNNLLDVDVLIIDEFSMIDLNMLCNIIEAIPKTTKILLFGDLNQLPPISTRSILKDISSHATSIYTEKVAKIINKLSIKHVLSTKKKNKYSNINDKIFLLKEKYRFSQNSELGILINAIEKNKKLLINQIFETGKFNNIKYFEIVNDIDYLFMIKNILKHYNNYLLCIKEKKSPREILRAFNKHQTLCCFNSGIFGVDRVNNFIESVVFSKKMLNREKTNIKNDWYEGKPIIITKNCNVLKLFNGEIGITLRDKKKHLKVFFLSSNLKIRSFPFFMIKNYKLAWAITIHRSQGSEYNRFGRAHV